MTYTLVVGNKNYSSWSLRAYLALALCDLPFEELRIPLRRPDSRARLLEYSPSGRVPVLLAADGPVWDSMAICEYLAERFPDAQLWPRDSDARALARSICAEMHSGFSALRTAMPMDLRRHEALPVLAGEVVDDIKRVSAIWEDCRARFAETGPFLFGHPGIADAFFAPVAARLHSYCVGLSPVAADYVALIHRWPAFVDWRDAAL